jgi:hypothetical protein
MIVYKLTNLFSNSFFLQKRFFFPNQNSLLFFLYSSFSMKENKKKYMELTKRKIELKTTAEIGRSDR